MVNDSWGNGSSSTLKLPTIAQDGFEPVHACFVCHFGCFKAVFRQFQALSGFARKAPDTVSNSIIAYC
eukprot:10725202-Alexandrium_andersonii.AAC.1